MLPIAALGIVLPEDVTRCCSATASIGETALELTATTLAVFLLGLAAHALIAVLARAFYARQDTATPVAAALVAVVVNIVLAVVLVGPLGAARAGRRDRDRRLGRAGDARRCCSGAGSRRSASGTSRVVHGARRSSRRRGRRRGMARRTARCSARGARTRASLLLLVRADRDRGRRRARHPRRVARLADPGAAVYRRGHGRPAPPPAPRVTAHPADAGGHVRLRRSPTPRRWDAFVAANDARLVPPAARLGAGQGRQRLVVAPPARGDGAGAQVLVRRPRPLPWAFAYAPRGPVLATLGRRARSRGSPRSCATDLRAPAGRVTHLRIDPEIEAGAGPRRGRRRHGRARGPPAGVPPPRSSRTPPASSTSRADEDALWGDLRKKWRQYVNKARSGGVTRRRRRAPTASASSTGSTARPPTGPASSSGPSRPTATSGRRSRPTAAPGCCSPSRPTARPRRRCSSSARAARRRAVRRDDPGRRRQPRELPAQVGGDPLVARGGRDELRPVGPRARRDRPLQDRLRRPRGPLRRGVGPRPRPARPAVYAAAQATRVRVERRRHGLRGRRRADGGRATGATPGATGDRRAAPRGRGARRLGRARRSTRRAATSSSRGRGPRTARRAAGSRGSWPRTTRGPSSLVRPWPLIGGGSALRPARPDRGRHAVDGRRLGRDGGRGARRDRVAPGRRRHRRRRGGRRGRGGRRAYRRALAAAGFHPIEEIQPSRHRMALPLPPGTDEAAVFDGIAKSTRQRIRRAERDGVVVVRWDASAGRAARASSGRPSRAATPSAASTTCCSRPASGAASRSGPDAFVAWWTRALAAGHLVYLEAREGAADGDVLGGLVLYRHGRRLSTLHSGDRAERRRDHPGALHLLRWRAIQLAIAEGADGDGPRRRRRRRRPPRAARGRADVRAVRAQAVVRGAVGRARRRPRARRPTVALRARARDGEGWPATAGQGSAAR